MTTETGPRSDDDTHDIIDHALTELAARRAAWLGDDLTVIALLASLIHQASTTSTRSSRPAKTATTAKSCSAER